MHATATLGTTFRTLHSSLFHVLYIVPHVRQIARGNDATNDYVVLRRGPSKR